jgi:hypothetical protein
MSAPRAVIGGVVAMLLVAACGSAAPEASPTRPMVVDGGTSASVTVSASTKMICEHEAQGDIAKALGTDITRPLAPTWVDHEYSCRYVYGAGAMRLSVKQLGDAPATRRYFDGLVRRLGRSGSLAGLGQGAFTTARNSVVVRKDDKVLVVDVRDLPTTFGTPPDTRANVAITVAATIMGCWTGE